MLTYVAQKIAEVSCCKNENCVRCEIVCNQHFAYKKELLMRLSPPHNRTTESYARK